MSEEQSHVWTSHLQIKIPSGALTGIYEVLQLIAGFYQLETSFLTG